LPCRPPDEPVLCVSVSIIKVTGLSKHSTGF
jgi:hypothetical protein